MNKSNSCSAFITASLCAFSLTASSPDSPRPDQWRGLVIDESTAEDVQRILGKPDSDKPDRLFVRRVEKWFIPGLRKKALRKQRFKEVAGFDRVDLYYYDDRLAVIQLDFAKGLSPSALQNLYGVEFFPYVDRLAEGMMPQDFERHKGKLYPKSYPIEYSLVAVTSRTILCASVSHTSIGSILARSAGIPDSTATFPGKVEQLQIISRKLENRQGEDLLR